MSKSEKIDRYSVEHGKVYAYSHEHRAYVYLTNTLTLKYYSGMKRITEKNVDAAVALWEDALLGRDDYC